MKKPEVARITIDILVNGAMHLPTDQIVEELAEGGLHVLSCCVETIKGKKLKGSLLKDATKTLREIEEMEGEDGDVIEGEEA